MDWGESFEELDAAVCPALRSRGGMGLQRKPAHPPASRTYPERAARTLTYPRPLNRRAGVKVLVESSGGMDKFAEPLHAADQVQVPQTVGRYREWAEAWRLGPASSGTGTTNPSPSPRPPLSKPAPPSPGCPRMAALKLLYLAVRNLTARWDAIQGWKEAMNRFRLTDGERIDAALARELSRKTLFALLDGR